MAYERKAETKPPVMQEQFVPEFMPTMGDFRAPIVVICDAPSVTLWRDKKPLGGPPFYLFRDFAAKYGFGENDFAFVCPCAPIPDQVDGSDRREKLFIDAYRDSLLRTLQQFSGTRLFVFLGKNAGYALTAKPVKITKERGVVRTIASLGVPVMPLLSPQHVLRRPEMKDIFDADFNMLRTIASGNWSVSAAATKTDDVDYEWREDISDLLANPPRGLAVDTETARKVGITEDVPATRWYRSDAIGPLTVQLAYKPGHALVVPVDRDYWPMGMRTFARIHSQLKQLLENPAVKKIGHNHKFDHHILRMFGITVQGWGVDNQLLAFFADENMFEKSQDECVRRWLPEMAGYADHFNQTTDKNNMRDVPYSAMLSYGGGDADSAFRLAKVLVSLVRQDTRQWNCCQRIQWPALSAFRDVVEQNGIMINTQALSELQTVLTEKSVEGYKELIKLVPGPVKRKHMEKGLEFTRADFVRDILFSKEGFNLTPTVFTPSTKKLPPEQRIASTSTKQHLPYFKDTNLFVAKYIDYAQLTKLQSTYVGVPDGKHGPTGFWQYIHEGYIHPSFLLHRTVTGRSSSENPNGQNIPKRGKLAKAYRKIFQARPGHVLIECDLSQAELRLAAWMAEEPTMIQTYRSGGDIHASTAAGTMGITIEAFGALADDVRKKKRGEAKPINFGYLYGMSWRKFKVYAKTDYELDFTDKAAEASRNGFFNTYKRLEPWHRGMRSFVREHGYVRSLHGAIRHLPNILSNDEGIRAECERQAINSPIQRFGSDIGLCALGRLCRDVDPRFIRPIAFIHDALVCEVPENLVNEAMASLKFYMETMPFGPWFGLRPPLPILADVSCGHNLSEMEEHPEIVSYAPEWWQMEQDGFEDIEEALQYARIG